MKPESLRICWSAGRTLNNLAALRQLSSVIFRGKCYTPKVKPIPQVEQELDNYL